MTSRQKESLMKRVLKLEQATKAFETKWTALEGKGWELLDEIEEIRDKVEDSDDGDIPKIIIFLYCIFNMNIFQ